MSTMAFMKSSELIINMGGLFSNPYGPWARMVYNRAPAYANTLQLLKNVLDPNKILNPGKLCF
jgi:glycolate oxidase